jgi:hypothetical protein
MLTVFASPGQGTLQIAPEKSAPGTFAVVVIKPRKGGDGLKYTVPMSLMPKLVQINSTIQDPLGRYNAVMALPNPFGELVCKPNSAISGPSTRQIARPRA